MNPNNLSKHELEIQIVHRDVLLFEALKRMDEAVAMAFAPECQGAWRDVLLQVDDWIRVLSYDEKLSIAKNNARDFIEWGKRNQAHPHCDESPLSQVLKSLTPIVKVSDGKTNT